MRIPSVKSFVALLGLAVVPATSFAILANDGIGSGPNVGLDFDVAALPTATGTEALFVAWRDAASDVASGVFRLSDESFTPFATLPTASLTNLSVGIGGAATDPRAYVAWVGNHLELVLATFDATGTLVSAAQKVANSVQISPLQISGTDGGALVGHSWDSNPYWDPRVLEVDVSGNAIALEIAENVVSPEQTLGTSVASEPGGKHAIAYITSDLRELRLRRYDGAVALDPSPVFVSANAGPDYVPLSTVFPAATVPSTALVAFPYIPAEQSPDVRFVLVPLSTGPPTLGPTLSDLVPGFEGRISDLARLADAVPRAVVIWQDVEFEDPNTCGCSVPPPVRIDFFAQRLRVSLSITADGPPQLVYQWQVGDEIGPPITEPSLVVASDTPGRFTVVWSDGVLRFRHIDETTVGLEPVRSPWLGVLATPNPFVGKTELSFSLPQRDFVRLSILDVRGQEVARIVDGMRPPGRIVIAWDGRNGAGLRAAAGIYFARLERRQAVDVTKVVLVK